MLQLEIYNFNELEPVYQAEIRKSVQDKKEYYEQLFKKYDKDLILKVSFNKDKEYRVAIEINMKSKDLQVVKTGKDPVKILAEAWKDFKKAVKKQIQLERKDYLYKRKRYRQQKWQTWIPEIEAEIQEQTQESANPKGKRKLKALMKAVQKYLKTRLKSLGFTKKQIKAQLPALTELIEKKFYEQFDPKTQGAEEMESLLFGIAEDILKSYQNTKAKESGEWEITEFEGDSDAPQEIFDTENIMLEDVTENAEIIDRAYDTMTDETIENIIQTVLNEQDTSTQAAVQMYYLEQLNEEEIAQALGQTKENVREQLKRFKNQVEEAFDKAR